MGGQRPFVVEQLDQRKDRRLDLHVPVVNEGEPAARLVELGNDGPVQALHGIGFHAFCQARWPHRSGLPGWPAIILVALPSHPASGTEEQWKLSTF